MPLAESRAEALDQARHVARMYQQQYLEATIGRQPAFDVPMDKVIDSMVDSGAWIVGTPDECIAGIERLGQRSGGFGGFLVQAIDWAPRENMLHSFELLARHVMPRFQGSLEGLTVSNQWSREHTKVFESLRLNAMDRARQVWEERQ